MLNDASCFKAVYIVCGCTDLRSGMDRLAALVEAQTGHRPYVPDTFYLFCPSDVGDAAEKVKKGIVNVSSAYQKHDISKDQLLRMRRLAYRMLMYMDAGKISWKRAPLYGKKFGNGNNGSLLERFLEDAHGRYAETILRRDESTIRQFILYCESEKSKNVEEMPWI